MQEQKRDFKGVWIAKEIWLDKRLNALEKVIFAEIDSLDDEETGCYAGNEYLAEFCQCSVSKVSGAISKLKQYGYIYEKSFDGRQRILKSRLTKNEKQTSKICKADYENLKANNISITDMSKSKNIKKERKTTYDDIIQASGFDERVKQSLYEFIKMRKLIKKPMTDRALTNLLSRLKRLSRGDNETADKILNQSIDKAWQDIYELKTDKQEAGKKDKSLEWLERDYEWAKAVEDETD